MLKRSFMQSIFLGCVCIVFSTFLFIAISVQAQDIKKPQILILNSYHQGVDWTDAIMDGIFSYFKKAKLNADIYIEYMDTKRNRPDKIFPSLYELYKLKYQKKKLDLIICSDNNALYFLLLNRDQLFPNVPIVFCGINNFQDSLIVDQKQITGVVEDHDIKGTIELALRLHPETKHIAVVCDNTPTGLADIEKLKPILSEFDEKVDFIKIFEFTGKELQQKLQSLPENTVVFSLTFFVDRDGKFYSMEESSALLAQSYDRPVYVVADFKIRNGVLGGVIASAKSQGEEAAEIAMRILQGESADSIQVLKNSPNIPMFDYKVMKQFGVNESDLPKGSVVMNKPFSFYDRYKGLVWATVLTIAVLIAIVLMLIGNIIQRRRTEEALRESEKRLKQSNSELDAKNKELEQVLYATSHDLRSPLVNVQGFNKELDASLLELNAALKSEDVPETVREKCAPILDEDIPESLHYILSSTFRMDALLNGLLVLSRLGRQKLTLKKLNMDTIEIGRAHV